VIKSFNMNLSFKILLVLGFYILGIFSMGFVSYNDLRTTEEKVELLELSYHLHNIILEIRRYEKNYLLYNNEESFIENKKFIDIAIDTQKKILLKAAGLRVAPMLREIDELILAYGANMDQLPSFRIVNIEKYRESEQRLRDQGKQMTDLSKELVEFERNQIHVMLYILKKQLLSWGSLAVFIGIFLSFLLILYIFRPLSIIKKVTEDISRGKFNLIEVLNTKDEMQQVVEAFNIMVLELEKRQDQIVQSEKLSSIGTLTAGVAHQLNNPLNNISTSCQIAIDELSSGDSDFIMKMLRNIDHETMRARDVVKGLLEFSRVQEFSLRPSLLSEVVIRAVKLAQSQVPADIGIRMEIPENLVLPMDAQRIQEVFINLIINATHSIGQKGEIVISAIKDESAKEVVIEVRDTGHGIPEEIQGRLFDPFYTTKEEGKGTGLGLSVAYGIIKKHHGQITVQSKPEQGASFFIHLPVAEEKENLTS